MTDRAETGLGGLAFWETQGHPAAFGPAEAAELLSFLRDHSGSSLRVEVGDWLSAGAGRAEKMRAYQLIPERPPSQTIAPPGIASTTKVGAGDQASTDIADYKAVVERDLDGLTQVRYIPKDQPLDAGQELLSDPSDG